MTTTKTKVINVTKEDIKSGTPDSVDSCPIALAVRRAFKTKGVYVYGTIVELERYTYPLPNKARRFVGSFDAGKPVKPFKFTARL